MDNKKVVSLVDEFDYWEEEILRKMYGDEYEKYLKDEIGFQECDNEGD
jgi:hypothetical protein